LATSKPRLSPEGLSIYQPVWHHCSAA